MKHVLIALVLVAVAAPTAGAQPADGEASQAPIDDLVARALLQRGRALFDQGDFANAKKMFVESLERSGKGPDSAEALTMLRAANEKLGSADLDAGRPGHDTAPIDPYGGNADAAPIDPYAGGNDASPMNPYGNGGGAAAGPHDTAEGDEANTETSRGLMAWSAGYGFSLGMAIGGPTDSNDNVRGGAVLLGLGGLAAAATGAYFVSHKVPLSRGQVAAIASAGNWGMIDIGFLGDVFTGEDTSTNDIYRAIAAGGAIGLGAGALWARNGDPREGDVAFTNSLGAYGTTAGLMLGVAMSPPRPEAYSINAVVGSAAGLVSGLWLSSKVHMSRRRSLRMDLGAAAGLAATWVLIYPLVADEGTNNDEQFAGFFSTVTMAAGAGFTYWLTRDMDEPEEAAEGELARRYPAPPGLIQRSASGRWSLGAPAPRPMGDPRLGGPMTGLALGVDLAGGRW